MGEAALKLPQEEPQPERPELKLVKSPEKAPEKPGKISKLLEYFKYKIEKVFSYDVKISKREYIKQAPNESEKEKLKEASKALNEVVDVRDTNTIALKKGLKLYEYAFPNPDEREDVSIVTQRLKDMVKMRRLIRPKALKERYGDSRYHVILDRTKRGEVVGCSQFSVMPVGKDQTVVYGQYTAIADKPFMKPVYGSRESYRGEGLYRVHHAVCQEIAARDAKNLGRKGGNVGMVGESEMIGQGKDIKDIQFTQQRLEMHRTAGLKAMMLEMEDGSLVSPHLQPRLSKNVDPIQLLMMYKPAKFTEEDLTKTTEMDKALAQSVVMSFVDNFDREGFAKKDVQEARDIANSKFAKAKRVILVPPEQLPDICELCKSDEGLRKQSEKAFGNLDEHKKKIQAALKQPKEELGRPKGL